MEKLGYLSKHNGVGKTKVLLLTELGQKVVDEVQSIRTKWWQQKFSETGLNSDSPLLKTIETVVDTIVEPLEG
jgi:hypothetical protein